MREEDFSTDIIWIWNQFLCAVVEFLFLFYKKY